ncbi:nucleotide disphospho-sugar-binding domain-containing protein [Actinomadura rifamycini]|uniref:nucleotide disphospho-sugar-binding domain-containing protein n=1 Tax=Actinomadura rifamycini TaxID=31962 RepID=UPI00040D51B6|nr:nucleotide disphospho-sugar-binding domain-containing protein [Actinomadura rifamycini]
MRILFTSWAWTTHFYPMVPLAWAARVAGHDVRFAAPSDLVPSITASGLPAVTAGEDFDIVGDFQERIVTVMDYENDHARGEAELAERHAARSRAVMEHYTAIAAAMTPGLLDYARAWRPDAVVYDPLAWAGVLVADDLGVPAVRSLFGPDLSAAIRPEHTDVLDPLLESLGLDRPASTLGDLTVDPCPPYVQIDAPVRRQHIRFVPYNALPVVPPAAHEPGRSGRPRVCLTWGTTTDRMVGETAFLPPNVLEAMLSLDAELVIAIAARQEHLLPDLPPEVTIAKSVPLDVLLPTCDLVVQRGGSGTSHTAALYGVPQLILPLMPDTLLTARTFCSSGAGVFLRPDEADAETIRENAARILEPDSSFRRQARALADDMERLPRMPDAVRALEELAA